MFYYCIIPKDYANLHFIQDLHRGKYLLGDLENMISD